MLCADPEYAYFDRTQYISTLSYFKDPVILFLRLHWFGKSLILSMLAHFYGIEHKKHYDELFKDLVINEDVKAGKICLSQYLVLTFDFAGLNHSHDFQVTVIMLNNMINNV